MGGTTRRSLTALSLVAGLLVASCSSAAAPTPQIVYVTPEPTAAPTPTAEPTLEPTAVPTPEPTAKPTPEPVSTPEPPTGLSGQDGVTTAMTDPGSLGMTLAAFVKRWNSVLDQGQYPLEGAPERDGSTFMFTPEGTSNTMLLGVLNDDGTIRAVDALSVAGGIDDKIDRLMAQLEALVIWSTLGRAANPRLTEAEGNMLLTDLGLPDDLQFGLVPPLVLDHKGVRYYIIEGDATTNFIAREAPWGARSGPSLTAAVTFPSP